MAFAASVVAFATLSIPWVACVLAGAVPAVVMWSRRESLLDPLGPVLLMVLTSATVPAVLGYFHSTPLVGIHYSDYSRAAVALLLFVSVCAVMYLIAGPRRPSPRPRVAAIPTGPVKRLWLLWAGTLALALFALGWVVYDAGSVGDYLDALTNRRVFFAGRGWIILLIVAPATVSLALVVMSVSGTGKLARRTLVALVVACVTSGALLLATGNRMNLVVFAASLTVAYDRCIRRLSSQLLVVGALVVLFLAHGVLGVIRPAGDADRAFQLPTADALYGHIDRTGPVGDFGHIPALALMMSPDSGLEREYGGTYLSAATILLPSALVPQKFPVAGEVVTREVLPRVWDNGTAIQVTAPGEAYLNFGWPGIVAIAVVFGVMLEGLRRLGASGRVAGALVFAIAIPRVALLMRGDFGNVTGFFLLDLAVLAVALAVVGFRRTLAPPSAAAYSERAA